MLKCVIDNAPIPESIVFPLVNRFGNIQRYSKQGNRARVRNTAFSVVRKYRNRKYKEEQPIPKRTERNAKLTPKGTERYLFSVRDMDLPHLKRRFSLIKRS